MKTPSKCMFCNNHFVNDWIFKRGIQLQLKSCNHVQHHLLLELDPQNEDEVMAMRIFSGIGKSVLWNFKEKISKIYYPPGKILQIEFFDPSEMSHLQILNKIETIINFS